MKLIGLIIVALLVLTQLNAQNRVVYGEVVVFNELRLHNIVVESKKTGTSVLTDSLGQFAVVCAPKDVLKFKSKTFRSKRVRIKPATDSVKVELSFVNSQESVEMAIGYGYISQDKATYAYSNLNNKQEDFCSYGNIYELIRGKVAGVQVGSSNSRPGQDQEIIIRGKNSLMASNTALLVVDGIIVSTIAHISPCEVKRIDFLKDAAASIYGSQGANGVVLIETIKKREER